MGGGPSVTADSGPYEIRLHREAARAFARLQSPLRGRVAAVIEALASEPRPAGAVRLAGRDDYRIRVGEYRVVYAVDEAERVVIVARIAHRREVFRRS